MVSAIVIDGYLQKKKKEGKGGFLASKYQRRWFELTSDTLAYAKDAAALKDGGDIEVFAIHELKYIKKLEDEKLEMKFPERVLRVKAESKGDHERWYEAIKDARQRKLDGQNAAQAKQLETLKMTHAKNLVMDSDDEDEPITVGRPKTPPKRAAVDAPKPLLQQPPVPSNRPPSPRSLLANPRMGTQMISTPSRNGGGRGAGGEDGAYDRNHRRHQQEEEDEEEQERDYIKPVRSRWQDEEDEDAAEQQQKQQHRQQHPDATGRNAAGPAPQSPARTATTDRLQLQSGEGPRPGAVGSPARGNSDRLTLGDARLPQQQPGAAGASGAAAAANRSLNSSLRANNVSTSGSAASEDHGRSSAVRGEKLVLGGDQPPARRPGSRDDPDGRGHVPSSLRPGSRDEHESRGSGPVPSRRPASRDEPEGRGSGPVPSRRPGSRDEPEGRGPAPSRRPGSREDELRASGQGLTRGSVGSSVDHGSPRPGGSNGGKKVEEWEEDDWDSSEDEGSGGKAGAGRGPAQPQQPQQRGGSGAGSATRDGGANGGGVRSSQERLGSRPMPHESPVGGRPNGGSAASSGSQPVAAGGRGRQPVQQQQQEQEEEEEEEAGEEALAKHAAGTDHLEENWDSEDDEEEHAQPASRAPAPPPARRPAAPAPQPHSQPSTPPRPQPQQPSPSAPPARSRIPGLPPPGPSSPSRPGQSPRNAVRAAAPPSPPHQSRLAAPPQQAPAARQAGRPSGRSSDEQHEPPVIKSNVVHDPNIKEDKGWVEEDWDDDDD